MNSEPCPHCNGTGRRIVPPPTTGGRGIHAGRKGLGRQHGYEATYAAGCRCDLCRAAHREGARRRREQHAE